MHGSEGCDLRALDDAEIAAVTGGSLVAAAVGTSFIAVCLVVGASWDLPIGATLPQAAAKLGMSHLL
jgi:hypothetical protein